MAPELQRITTELLALPTTSRALLARMLLDSLGSTDVTQDVEQSWILEAYERARQVDAGAVELVDEDDVFREMRAICR